MNLDGGKKAELSGLATRIDEASDAVKASIDEFEKYLEETGLKVEVWLIDRIDERIEEGEGPSSSGDEEESGARRGLKSGGLEPKGLAGRIPSRREAPLLQLPPRGGEDTYRAPGS